MGVGERGLGGVGHGEGGTQGKTRPACVLPLQILKLFLLLSLHGSSHASCHL